MLVSTKQHPVVVGRMTLDPEREGRWWSHTRQRCADYGVYYQPGISLEELCKRSGGRCAICRVPLVGNGWAVDHRFALGIGGTHTPRNLRITCIRCNSSKGIKITSAEPSAETHALVVAALVSAQLRDLPGHRSTACKPGPISVNARTTTSRLRIPRGRAKAVAIETEEIRAALSVLDDDLPDQAIISVSGRYLVIETPSPFPLDIAPALLQPAGTWLHFGVGQDMQSVGLDLSRVPVVLVAGRTGSGKSTCLHTLAWSAARCGHGLILVDAAKPHPGFVGLEDLDALALGVPASTPDVLATLRATVALMESRDPRTVRDRIVVIVDEVSALCPDGQALLAILAEYGRKHGMTTVFADRRFAAKRIPRVVVEQAVVRIALQVGDHWAANAIEMPGSDRLLGRGDALVRGEDGLVSRVQVVPVGGRWSEIARRPEALPTVAAAPRRPSQREDDTEIIAAARAHGVTTIHGVHQLTKRLGLGRGGKSAGMGRSTRVARTLTGTPAGQQG